MLKRFPRAFLLLSSIPHPLPPPPQPLHCHRGTIHPSWRTSLTIMSSFLPFPMGTRKLSNKPRQEAALTTV